MNCVKQCFLNFSVYFIHTHLRSNSSFTQRYIFHVCDATAVMKRKEGERARSGGWKNMHQSPPINTAGCKDFLCSKVSRILCEYQ